ncbi:unnamed protein product [Caenorhabditis angaria]|uniref:Uncharacterized protein n=1 Tax=Caenorhabditis angaria TaxID=860376 RepID=A0A9P1I9S4_9PELO|nr:unnamed protein product [Caenorhabditis angaria]
MLNNLGTRLFKSVTDRAGDLGDKFETQFEFLTNNFTAEVDLFIQEAVELSTYCKVTLGFLIILLILLIFRYSAFGIRVMMNEGRSWFHYGKRRGGNDNEDDAETAQTRTETENEPRVILLMPDENGQVRINPDVSKGEKTKKQILDKLGSSDSQKHLFNNKKKPMLPPRKYADNDNNDN